MYSVISRGYGNGYHERTDEVLYNICKDEFKVIELPPDIDRKEEALLKINKILESWMR